MPTQLKAERQAHRSHAVAFYTDEGQHVAAVARHLAESLSTGGAAITIATPAHREAIEEACRRQPTAPPLTWR